MQGVRLSTGETLNADQYIFCCGPWLGKVFPFLSAVITAYPSRVSSSVLRRGSCAFTDAQMPVWIDGGKNLFYGIPGNHWRGFKVADDAAGPAIDPSTMERQISKEGLEAARRFLGRRFRECPAHRCWRAALPVRKLNRSELHIGSSSRSGKCLDRGRRVPATALSMVQAMGEMVAEAVRA